MIVLTVNDRGASLALTGDEMRIISNALNEACNGLDVEEFSTRLGADRAEVEVVLLGLLVASDAHDAAAKAHLSSE
jgi:hypothetical protein